MGNTKRFVVGSKAFFSSFDDFKPNDTDVVIIQDNPPKGKVFQKMRMRKTDYFIYKSMPKYDLIHLTITRLTPMYASMFLIPEFADSIGVTIEDLDLLQNVFYHIDDKHSYEKMIYEYYRQNNGFYLNDEQLKAVYEDYKSKRPKIYSVE